MKALFSIRHETRILPCGVMTVPKALSKKPVLGRISAASNPALAGRMPRIVLGISFAKIVDYTFADFRTIVPLWGVVLSFVVSAAVGITFGLYPARAAARLDPIEALNAGSQTQ